jgi:hypothetical protein
MPGVPGEGGNVIEIQGLIRCDRCGAEYEARPNTSQEQVILAGMPMLVLAMRLEAKRLGWGQERTDEGLRDYCPECEGKRPKCGEDWQ